MEENSNYPIAWKDEYSVQVKELDDQHKHFVGILNNLYTALQNMELEAKIKPILDDLVAYAVTHFSTEEKYFDMFGYELAGEHKLKHKELLDQVNVFMQRYKTEGTKIIKDLLDFLEDWLVQHLAEYDQKYVQCFKEHGLA
mgnify:CR=1 FL=1